MGMTRTNVYAESDDLALIKQVAERRGVSEAAILREGIHLAAMGARLWDEPFVSETDTVDLGGPVTKSDIRQATQQATADKEARLRDRR